MHYQASPEALISATIIWSDDVENLRGIPS